MKWINNLIPAEDKLKHFYLGAWVFFILMLIIPSPSLNIFLLLCVAVGKEAYDGITKTGKMEIFDIIYTILPGIFFLIYYLIHT